MVDTPGESYLSQVNKVTITNNVTLIGCDVIRRVLRSSSGP